MEKFAKYLAAFDGTRDWTEIKPLYDDLFHPDCVVVTADGEMNTAQWEQMARGLAEKKAKASDFEVLGREGDAFHYRLTITMGDGESMHLTAKGTVRDGQLARVEPVDPSAYSTMMKRST